MSQKSSRKHNKLIPIGIFVIATILMFLPLFARDSLKTFESFGLASIFFINLITSATLFLPAPGVVSVAVGGNLYNPLLVALLAALGSTIGEGVGFLFGYSSKEIIDTKKHKLFYHLAHFTFQKYAKFIIPIVAFIPNPLLDGVGIFAGMAEYSPKKFFVLVFAGRLARNIIIAYTFS